MAVILRTEDLFKEFSGIEVLGGITMEVREGERHIVIGPNGAGKTTLFNIITGLYRPSSGGRYTSSRRRLPAIPLTRLPGWVSARSFQIINVFPKMTVYENIRNGIVSKADKPLQWMSLLIGGQRCYGEPTEEIIAFFALGDVRETFRPPS